MEIRRLNDHGQCTFPTGSSWPFVGVSLKSGADPNSQPAERTAFRIFTWRRESAVVLQDCLRELLAVLADSPDAFVEVERRNAGTGRCCLAVVADGTADLHAKVSTAIKRLDHGGSSFGFAQGIHFGKYTSPVGGIAFMFPGQG